MRVATLAALAFLAAAPHRAAAQDANAASPPDGDAFAFVYVDANVGGASGGHVALRIGERAFHFQRFPDGAMRLVRDDWARFAAVYGGLQNRSLAVAVLDVAPAARERVLRTLLARFAEQEIDLARLARLERDAAWLAALEGRGPAPTLRGAGLLAATPEGDEGAARLRASVEARLPPGRLVVEAADAASRVADLVATDAPPDLESLREALLSREAIAALTGGRGLARGVLIPAGGDGAAALSGGERAALARWSDALEATIAELATSRRPDRGFPMLLAIARWHAAQRSLAAGRLLVLGALPEDAPALPAGEGLRPASYAALAERGRGLLAQMRAAFADPGRPVDESLLRLIEETASRTAEADRGAAGLPVRDAPERLLPQRARSIPPPALAAPLAPIAQANARDLAAQRALVARRHGYLLLTRNCVTELVRTVNDAFPDEAAARAALGGYVAPGEGLTFIPFVFYDAVRERYRVARADELPGRRRRELARLYTQSSPLAVYPREANVVTSTLYTPRWSDGGFLLFTDDVFWPRPLYGVANLAYGLVQTAAGALAAPFDRGRLAQAGARGMLFSVPELFFANVRKGTNEVAESGLAQGDAR